MSVFEDIMTTEALRHMDPREAGAFGRSALERVAVRHIFGDTVLDLLERREAAERASSK